MAPLLDYGEVLPLLLTIGILSFVGQEMVAPQAVVRLWGVRLAAFAFIGYAACARIKDSSPDAQDLLGIAFRSILTAGLA